MTIFLVQSRNGYSFQMSTQTLLSGPVVDIFLIRKGGELIAPFQRSPQRVGSQELSEKHSCSRPVASVDALGLYFGLFAAILTGEAPDANIWLDLFLL